jgi:hypothetical protein
MTQSRHPRETKTTLLQAYQSSLSTLTPTMPLDQWKSQVEPLLQRTLIYLESTDEETELYSANELTDRLAEEDIEVHTEVSLCILHPTDWDSEETDLSKTMTEMHFLGTEDTDYIQFDGTRATLLDFAARFGIAPDEKVWAVNEDL